MKWPKLWFVNNIINSNQESHSSVFMSGIFVLHAHKSIRIVHSKKWLKLHSLNVTDTLRDDMHKFMLNESIKCQIKILSHSNSIFFCFYFQRIFVCFSLHLFAWLRILAEKFRMQFSRKNHNRNRIFSWNIDRTSIMTKWKETERENGKNTQRAQCQINENCFV